MPYVMRSDLLTLSLFLFLLLTGCNRGEGTFYRETGERFTTYYTVTYRAEEPLAEQIDSTMDAFNAVLNNFDPNSVVSRINANSTDQSDPMLEEVLRQAMIVYSLRGRLSMFFLCPVLSFLIVSYFRGRRSKRWV